MVRAESPAEGRPEARRMIGYLFAPLLRNRQESLRER